MKLARRQLMLLGLFAAIAYGWFQTKPGHYAEMPIDPDPMGILPVPPGLGSAELAGMTRGSEEWIFRGDQVSLSVGWTPEDSGVRVFVRKTKTGSGFMKLEALLHDDYYPDEIKFYTNPDELYRLTFDSDSVDIHSPDQEVVRLPFPPGALFADLICFQAMAWKGLLEPVKTQWITLVPDEIPIRSMPVEIRPLSDSAILISGVDSQQVLILFDDSSPRVRHFCASAGLCAEGHPPMEQ